MKTALSGMEAVIRDHFPELHAQCVERLKATLEAEPLTDAELEEWQDEASAAVYRGPGNLFLDESGVILRLIAEVRLARSRIE